MDEIVKALIDHHAKQGRKIRITKIKRGNGTIAGCRLIPGRLEIKLKSSIGDVIRRRDRKDLAGQVYEAMESLRVSTNAQRPPQ